MADYAEGDTLTQFLGKQRCPIAEGGFQRPAEQQANFEALRADVVKVEEEGVGLLTHRAAGV